MSGVKYVLDEFHLSKYMNSMTSHMLDSAWDARQEVKRAIRSGVKADFEMLSERLLEYAKTEDEVAKIKKSSEYIMRNLSAAKMRLTRMDDVVGSSTEGHVYHILSARMSTDPLGWSRYGASQMAKFREYKYNSGDMFELAKYQKMALPKAAGAEEIELSASAMLVFSKRVLTRTEEDYKKYSECFHSQLPKYLEKEMNRYNDYYYVRSWF